MAGGSGKIPSNASASPWGTIQCACMPCGPICLTHREHAASNPTKKRARHPTSRRALQIGENAAILHQGFHRIRAVSESMDETPSITS